MNRNVTMFTRPTGSHRVQALGYPQTAHRAHTAVIDSFNDSQSLTVALRLTDEQWSQFDATATAAGEPLEFTRLSAGAGFTAVHDGCGRADITMSRHAWQNVGNHMSAELYRVVNAAPLVNRRPIGF